MCFEVLTWLSELKIFLVLFDWENLLADGRKEISAVTWHGFSDAVDGVSATGWDGWSSIFPLQRLQMAIKIHPRFTKYARKLHSCQGMPLQIVSALCRYKHLWIYTYVSQQGQVDLIFHKTALTGWMKSLCLLCNLSCVLPKWLEWYRSVCCSAIEFHIHLCAGGRQWCPSIRRMNQIALQKQTKRGSLLTG